jgi:hypothetical protein
MDSVTGVSKSVAAGEVSGGVQARVVKGALEQEEAVVNKLLSSLEPARSPAQPTGQNLNLKA